ncbi:MAG: uracil-DNA glycosylase [Gammaproteobacteria bacterium]|nr:uracil-DNA glycosylase [Gammaproteobacteria bacterium]
MTEVFDVNCRRCPRLAAFLDEVRDKHPDYYCRPVPPFGDANARLMIAGLAPGMHGANRTGRPFTGDYAGVLLYETLYKFGFSSAAESLSADDPLKLVDCRISNAVKCLPPDNKPVGAEINACNEFIANELAALPNDAIVVALGGIAHRAVVKAVGGRQVEYKFAHLAEHNVAGRFTMLDSYHCSRYNTNTGRLTPATFEQVFSRARQLLDH